MMTPTMKVKRFKVKNILIKDQISGALLVVPNFDFNKQYLSIDTLFFGYNDYDFMIYNLNSEFLDLSNFDYYYPEINYFKIDSINISYYNRKIIVKNIFYNMIMKKSFNQGLKNITEAFEKRAIQLFKNV